MGIPERTMGYMLILLKMNSTILFTITFLATLGVRFNIFIYSSHTLRNTRKKALKTQN